MIAVLKQVGAGLGALCALAGLLLILAGFLIGGGPDLLVTGTFLVPGLALLGAGIKMRELSGCRD